MDEIIYEKLSSLSEISKAQLQKILNSVPNNKDLTIEPNLIKPLERVCGVTWLKTHGVDRIFKLDAPVPKTVSTTTTPQFYIIYPNSNTFQKVVQRIQSTINQNDLNNSQYHNKYHIICVPKSLDYFNYIIEENALWNIVKLYSFQWFPFHLDEGTLSLELPSMFRSIYINEDYSLLPAFAKSLWHLFLTLGKPGFSLALGSNSNIVMKQLELLLGNISSDENKCKSKIPESEIGGLIVIDRNLDYPSVLLTPGTYSALLNEVYGVKCGVCKEEKAENVDNNLDEQFNKVLLKQPVNFVLDSKKDSVYKMIKDKNFVQVTEILRTLTKDLKVQGETSDMALHEMKRYVQTKLQSVAQKKQLVTCHLNAAETLVNFLHNRLQKLIDVESNILQNQSKSKSLSTLEEYLQTERDATSALALFLLVCTTQKVSDSEVKSFLTKFFIEFGYNFGHIYQKLVKCGFIESISNSKLKLQILSKSTFYSNAGKMKQLIAEPARVNLKSPTCCSYVFGGLYIPLIAQVASLVLSGTPVDDLRHKLMQFGELNVNGRYQVGRKSLMVYVVGGITYSEIAALNLLESLMGVKIVKISDRIISKCDIANAFMEV